jgi:hypothetical protein
MNQYKVKWKEREYPNWLNGLTHFIMTNGRIQNRFELHVVNKIRCFMLFCISVVNLWSDVPN